MTSSSDLGAPRLHPSDLPVPPRHRGARWGGGLVVGAVLVWAVAGTGIGIGSLIDGRQGGARMLRGMLSPDLSAEFLGIVWTVAVETLQISLAGLVLAVVFGLPLAVLQARNAGAPRVLRHGARYLATVLRGIPELLWALLFVATVGLGPAAGVYAIGLHGAGLLSKLCGELLESVDPAPVEAVRMTGASAAGVTALAILPQTRTGLVSLALYQWECNIRTATVVGFVGGGGIGQALDISLKLFRYAELSTLVLAVLVLIIGVDQISRIVRRRLGAAA